MIVPKIEDTDAFIDQTLAVDIQKTSIFSSLKRPANVIEWVMGSDFLANNEVLNMKGQYYALRQYFQCYCPYCAVVNGGFHKPEAIFDLTKEEIIKRDHLLVYDWEKNIEYCPKCGLTKQDFFDSNELHKYDVMVGVIGRRAGKTMLGAMSMSFLEGFCVSVGNIKNFLGLKGAPFIEMGCVAISEEQAKDTIWAQFRALRNESPWYKQYYEIIRDNLLERKGLFEETTKLIRNDLVGLHIRSLHSSSPSLAGRTRMFWIVDELSKFDTGESKRSGNEVWREGVNSLKTVRKKVAERKLPAWLGTEIGIGSPISIDDFGVRLLDLKSENYFKMHLASWDFNREFTEADFSEEFFLDPVGASRDFGAKLVGGKTPFFEDWETQRVLMEDTSLKPLVLFVDSSRQESVSNQIVTYRGKSLTYGIVDRGEWVVAGDAGKSRDTFALVGCKRMWIGNDFHMIQGFVMHILPDGSHKIYVDFLCIVPLFEALQQRLPVKLVTMDYWNSEHTIQKLQNLGFRVEPYAMSSARTEDFESFKLAVLGRRIHLLPRNGSEDGDPALMDSQTRQYWEMKRMERTKDLKRVDHGDRSTSDIFECDVNCWRMLNARVNEKGGTLPQSGEGGGMDDPFWTRPDVGVVNSRGRGYSRTRW